VELRGASIAVTDATGFLGRYVVDTLLSRGARVVGVVRNPDRVPELALRGAELRRADLADRERLARGFAGADAVVSNAPCAIYGAFDPNFTAAFRSLVGLPISIMPAWLRLSLVYAGDVAEAVARALERPLSAGRAYNVTGDDLPVWEFARAWREAGGRGAWLLLPIPVPLVRMFDNGAPSGSSGGATGPSSTRSGRPSRSSAARHLRSPGDPGSARSRPGRTALRRGRRR